MDTIHIVDGHQTDRMYSENDLPETGYDVASVNSLPLFELIDQHMKERGEQRAHKRFLIGEDAFALIRPAKAHGIRVTDRSMGEIACAVYRSKSVKFGRIKNISLGGLSFCYIAGEDPPSQSLVLDILLADCGFYLESLMFKTIVDFEVDPDFSGSPIQMRQHHIEFERIMPVKILKLKYLIRNYSKSTEGKDVISTGGFYS
jgi:hypothetical protein